MLGDPILALVPWYGTKRLMAPHTIRQLGVHSAYFAPFCGSMAVELAKAPCKYELVNDLHGDLINLAEIVRDPMLGAKLFRWLRRTTPITESLFMESASLFEREPDCTRRPDLERAYHFFVCSWLGMNGVAGLWPPRISFCARFAVGGGTPGVRFENAYRSIPWWRDRMRRMMILCRDGFKVLSRIEDKRRIAIYVDPPYLTKSAKYKHDFEAGDPNAKDSRIRQWGDHGRLAVELSRFKLSRVVVSYYDHEALPELYPGWTMLQYKAGGMSNAVIGKKTRLTNKVEVLLVNGPVYDGGMFDSILLGVHESQQAESSEMLV